jgi:hypothetical protein
MAIDFFDGFDQYSADAALAASGRWGGYYASGANMAVLTTGGRLGGGAVQIEAGSAARGFGRTFSARTHLHMGIALRLDAVPTGSNGGLVLRFMDGVAEQQAVMFVRNDGTLVVARLNSTTGVDLGAAVALVTYPLHLGTGQYHHIELHVKAGSASGRVRLWVDNALIGTFDGNVSGAGTVWSSVQVGTSLTMNANSGVAAFTIDDVFIATESTDDFAALGDSRVEIIYPTSEQSNTGWLASAGTTVTAVKDEDDATYIEADAVDDQIIYDSTDVLASTPLTVHAVAVTQRSAKAEAGLRTLRGLIKPASTIYEGSDHFLAEGITEFMAIWETNPEGSAAWTKASIEASLFGVKIEQ